MHISLSLSLSLSLPVALCQHEITKKLVGHPCSMRPDEQTRWLKTRSIADLLEEHAVQSYGHLYADDTQFHDSCRSDDTDTLRSRLSCCADDINSWCKTRRLQLNADNTEAIWVGSRSNLAKIANSDGSVQVGSSNIQPSTVVRDLGLHFDIT